MKILYIFVLVTLTQALPATENREGRNVFREFLGNIGVLRIIPRSCATDSAFLGKGMCSLASDCEEAGGAIAGSCERAGVCCVVPAVCGAKIQVKRSWFINDEFPKSASEAYSDSCELTVAKSSPDVTQVRLDFDKLVLSRASDGTCNTDSLEVLRTGVDGMEQAIPVLCGDNSGQHVYIDMPPGDVAEISIKVKVGEQLSRSAVRGWRIHVTQLDETEAAPKRCLQYYEDDKVIFRSLNYDASEPNYLLNDDYDICFKKLKQFREEADENVGEENSYNVCKREFEEVNVQQSFAPGSEMTLRTRVKREKNPAKTSSIINPARDELVVSQIQKFVTQLKNNEKKAQKVSIIDNAKNNPDEKTNMIEESSNAKLKVKSESSLKTSKDKEIKKGADIMSPVEINDNKEIAPIDSIVNRVKELAKKQMAKDIMTKKPTNLLSKNKITAKKNENMKLKEDEQRNSEEKSKLKKTNPIRGIGTVTLLSSSTDNQNSVKLIDVPMPDKPINSLKPIPVRKSPISELEPTEVEETPEVKPVIYSPEEAEEMILSDFRCRGTYLMANDNKVCGSFIRTAQEDSTDLLKDADRISLRAIKEPQTSLRFSMRSNVICRVITTTTTSTTESTSTSRFPIVPIAIADSTSNSTDVRRVGIIQYLLGWY